MHSRLHDVPVKIVVGRFIIPVILPGDKDWLVRQLVTNRPFLLSGLGSAVLGNLLDASDQSTVLDELLAESDEEPQDQAGSSGPDDERGTPAEQAQLADFYENEWKLDKLTAIRLGSHSVAPWELAEMSIERIASEFEIHSDIAGQVSRMSRPSVLAAEEHPDRDDEPLPADHPKSPLIGWKVRNQVKQ